MSSSQEVALDHGIAFEPTRKDEDRAVCVTGGEAAAIGADAVAAVFDGHGGARTSSMCEAEMVQAIAQQLGDGVYVRGEDGWPEGLDGAIERAFEALDKRAKQEFQCGTTATLVLVRRLPEGRGTRIKCAWVGDSRAVLVHGHRRSHRSGPDVDDLSVDHTAANPDEFSRLARFYASNGTVRFGTAFSEFDTEQITPEGSLASGDAWASQASAGGSGSGRPPADSVGEGSYGRPRPVPSNRFLSAVTENSDHGTGDKYSKLAAYHSTAILTPGVKPPAPRVSGSVSPTQGSPPKPPVEAVDERGGGSAGVPGASEPPAEPEAPRTPEQRSAPDPSPTPAQPSVLSTPRSSHVEGRLSKPRLSMSSFSSRLLDRLAPRMSSSLATKLPSAPVQSGVSFVGAYEDENGTVLSKPRIWSGDESGTSLALSRTIGDAKAARGVVAQPDISNVLLPHGASARLVVCSDGVWDVVSSKRCADLVRAHADPKSAAGMLAYHADKGRRRHHLHADDITVITLDVGTPVTDADVAGAGAGSCACAVM